MNVQAQDANARIPPSPVAPQRRIRPTNPFIEFDRAEIERSIPERFEQQVAKYPDKLAVRTRSREFTYRALNESANQLAHEIVRQRGTTSEPIALLLGNDAPAIAAILGVLKAGKMYVVLDLAHPCDRNRFLLGDSAAGLIVTDTNHLALANELTHGDRAIINLDELRQSPAVGNLELFIPSDNPTWILYTSGSTGEPKGVVQNHRNVLHYAMIFTNELHINSADRLTLLFTFSVNAATLDIFRALLNGASLHVWNVNEAGTAGLARWLADEAITVYCSVATVYRHFIATLTGQELFPHLRLINLVGEPVDIRDVAQYQRHFSRHCLLVNRLGSTEVGTIRWYFMDHETRIEGNKVPVGFAVEDNEILLLDGNDPVRLDDPNHVGEIAVKSKYLSPGYWRRPDLTHAAFRPDPAGSDARIYRTGDMGRMLPDGRLLHMGRKDFQVKIRGHRIELGEIEHALRDLPVIREAAVIARDDQHGDPRLVAYIVPRGPSMPTVSALWRMLADKLPDFMLPAIFVPLDQLPKSPNGKISLSALPPPDASRPLLDCPYAAPRTPVENLLVNIWSEVLDVSPVGIDDNFLELGGTSLRATQVASRIQSRCGVELPIRALFDAPTVSSLAVIVESVLSDTGDSGLDGRGPHDGTNANE